MDHCLCVIMFTSFNPFLSSACFVFNKTHIFDCSHFIDTLNVCNDVNYVSATHDTRKVFPSIRNSISIPRHVTFLKNDSIDKSHLPLTNYLLLKQNLLPHLLLQIWTFQNVLSLCMKSQLLKCFIMFLHQWSFLCFLWYCFEGL